MREKYKNALEKKGFCFFDGKKELGQYIHKKDLIELRDAFKNLPLDEYAPNTLRYRKYKKAIITPHTGEITFLKNIKKRKTYFSLYYQGKWNPEYIDTARYFPSIEDSLCNNSILKKLIEFDFLQTSWTKRESISPIHIGVHFIKIMVKNQKDIGISSPNFLHQDGEKYTFGHLISRKNITGGINAIATLKSKNKLPKDIDKKNLLKIFCMKDILESYAVNDTKITHYLSEIKKGEKKQSGERNIILIDFQSI